MRSLERALIATVVDQPRFAPALFANTTDKTFTDDAAGHVWAILKELYDKGEGWTWAHVADLTKPNSEEQRVFFKDGFLSDMAKAASMVPVVLQERQFIEYLEKVKRARAKVDLLKKVETIARGSIEDPDITGIEDIVKAFRLEVMRREDPGPMVPFQEYLNYLNAKNPGITTGFSTLDRVTDNLGRGELIVVMGRPTTGKTMLCLNIFRHVAFAFRLERPAFFSLEMPKQGICERLLQMQFRKSRWDLKGLVPLDDSWKDIYEQAFKNTLVFGNVYSAKEITQLIEENNITIAFVDFLGLIKDDKPGLSLYQAATEKIKELKMAAKNLNRTIFVMVQLSRAAGDGSQPVTLEMARDSGAIEEVGDFIYGMWRPEISDRSGPEWTDTICLKILKNKRGSTKGIKCHLSKITGEILEEEDIGRRDPEAGG
jgi:replicative DNA helicase